MATPLPIRTRRSTFGDGEGDEVSPSGEVDEDAVHAGDGDTGGHGPEKVVTPSSLPAGRSGARGASSGVADKRKVVASVATEMKSGRKTLDVNQRAFQIRLAPGAGAKLAIK
jgi:hypothetical protein